MTEFQEDFEEEVELADFLYDYPDENDEHFQEKLTSKGEFAELVVPKSEPVPERGKFFTHQKFVHRYLRTYDRLILLWGAGVGKTGGFAGAAEFFKNNLKDARKNPTDLFQEYLSGKDSLTIDKVYLITKKILKQEFRKQLTCRYTKKGEYQSVANTEVVAERTRKQQLTTELKKENFYKIFTYETFIKYAKKKAGRIISSASSSGSKKEERVLVAERVRDFFSGSMFIVDEFHNLTLNPKDLRENVRSGAKITNDLQFIFENVVRSKIVLTSATPMSNNTDDMKSVMNLILPKDMKMGEDINLETASVEDLSVYFSSRISYIRESATKVTLKYQGQPLNLPLEDSDEISQNLVYYRTEIIDNPQSNNSSLYLEDRMIAGIFEDENGLQFYGQDTTYEKSGIDVKEFSSKQRQLSIVTPPDGVIRDSNGKFSGIKRFMTVDKEKWKATDELKPFLKGNKLRTISSKLPELLRLVKYEPGNAFVYSNFISNGVGITSLVLEANGFEYFKGDINFGVGAGVGVGAGATNYCDSADDEVNDPENLEFEKSPFDLTESVQLRKNNRLNQRLGVLSNQISSSDVPILRPDGSKYYTKSFDPEDIENEVILPNYVRPRYAMLTTKNEARHQAILRVFNSWENRHGELIKVLITSELGREGISTANVLQIHILDSLWHQSGIYQAIKRSDRATSHEALINEKKEWLLTQGKNPETANIEVKVYLHTALRALRYKDEEDNYVDQYMATRVDNLVPEPFNRIESTDERLYRKAEQKDRKIRPVLRKIKMVAVDCQLNKARNIQENDQPNSAECDFDPVCDYTCIDPTPQEFDYSSYSLLYSEIFVQLMSLSIEKLFLINVQWKFADFYKIFSMNFFENLTNLTNLQENLQISKNLFEQILQISEIRNFQQNLQILLNKAKIIEGSDDQTINENIEKNRNFLVNRFLMMTLSDIIEDKVLYNNFGQKCKLGESGDLYYLYPVPDFYNFSNDIYDEDEEEDIFEDPSKINNNYHLVNYTANPNYFKINHLDEIIDISIQTDIIEMLKTSRVFDYFNDIPYLTNEFRNLMNRLDFINLKKLLESLYIDGKLDITTTIPSTPTEVINILESPTTSFMTASTSEVQQNNFAKGVYKYLEFRVYEIDGEVYHSIRNTPLNGQQVVALISGNPSQLRRFDKNGKKWLDYTDIAANIKLRISENIKEKKIASLYGNISDASIENFNQQKYYGVVPIDDKKLRIVKDKGRICETLKKTEIVDRAWYLGLDESDLNISLDLDSTNEALINSLQRYEYLIDDTWDNKRLQFYYIVNNNTSLSRSRLCQEIRNKLVANNKIVYM